MKDIRSYFWGWNLHGRLPFRVFWSL